MDILEYVKQFGNKSFVKHPFNEVDGLIFAELAYINFDLVIPENKLVEFHKIKIKDEKPFYEGSVDAKQNKKLVDLMINSKRYKNVKIGYWKASVDKKEYAQFFALTFIIPHGTAYIAFRGTDTSILGWREDLYLVYQDDMPSQDKATEYVNEVTKLFPGNFYIGGHSKGGNLSLYAALHMNTELHNRLINAYSYDGPGFRTDVKKLKTYKQIKNKIVKFVTANDMVGIVYNQIKDPKIVYSKGIMLGGHDPFTWGVEKDGSCLRYVNNRTSGSAKFEQGVMNWLTKMNDEDKKLAVDVLYRLTGDANNIYDLLLKAARLIRRRSENLSDYTSVQIARVSEIYRRLGRFLFKAYSPKIYLRFRSKQITTHHLKFRKVKKTDAQKIFDNWASDPEVTKYMTWNPHENVKVTNQIIKKWLQEYKDPKCQRFGIVLKENNELIGMIDVVDYVDGKPEIGYCLSRQYWNKGYMTEACDAFVNYLFSLGYQEVLIEADEKNIGSNRVIEKCGFTFTHKETRSPISQFKKGSCVVNWYKKENM